MLEVTQFGHGMHGAANIVKISGIDPNSIPGKGLKQRYEDSKAGKIQRGSRSYQLPDHTRPREIDGKILSYDEYKGMPFYIKILEEAGRLDEIEKIRGTK